jgi:hypothetical protein
MMMPVLEGSVATRLVASLCPEVGRFLIRFVARLMDAWNHCYSAIRVPANPFVIVPMFVPRELVGLENPAAGDMQRSIRFRFAFG